MQSAIQDGILYASLKYEIKSQCLYYRGIVFERAYLVFLVINKHLVKKLQCRIRLAELKTPEIRCRNLATQLSKNSFNIRLQFYRLL